MLHSNPYHFVYAPLTIAVVSKGIKQIGMYPLILSHKIVIVKLNRLSWLWQNLLAVS